MLFFYFRIFFVSTEFGFILLLFCVYIFCALEYGSVDLPQNTQNPQKSTPKTNWILHKHLNKHRNNEQMWNLCFYVYLFIINQKYWRVNQRAITQLVISSCRIKYIYIYMWVSVCTFMCIYLFSCPSTTIIDISPQIFKLIYCCCVSIIIVICIVVVYQS